MTKVAIITYVCNKSSKQLAEALRNNGVPTDVFNLTKDHLPNMKLYDSVFSYGAGYNVPAKHRFNSAQAVLNCVDKPTTFDLMKKAGVSTVEYCTRRQDVPKKWDWVVVREKVDGRKAEGLAYHENNEKLPNGQLFSEYFEHKYEYRIMVFNGEVVGRYFKAETDGDWYFNLQPAKGFEKMDDHCLRAAKALGIDYVGFDVVAVNKNNFKILEANSGARITDESENAVVSYYINL